MNVNLQLGGAAAPNPSVFVGQKFVRVHMDVSMEVGNTNLGPFFTKYDPYINGLIAAGVIPILLFTHETWGEGQGFNYTLDMYQNPNHPEWTRYIDGNTNMIQQIAQHYAGLNVYFQIGNEPDANHGAESSIPMLPQVYGRLVRVAYDKIKAVKANAILISAGFMQGAGAVVQYYQAAQIGAYVNYVACHPYGQTPRSHPDFFVWGWIDEYMSLVNAIPKPKIITEIGILNNQGAAANRVITFFEEFIKVAKAAGYCWWAAIDLMHGCWGCWTNGGQLKEWNGKSILSVNRGTGSGEVPGSEVEVDAPLWLSHARYFRTGPGKDYPDILMVVPNQTMPVMPTNKRCIKNQGYIWREFEIAGNIGWYAMSGNGLPKASLKQN